MEHKSKKLERFALRSSQRKMHSPRLIQSDLKTTTERASDSSPILKDSENMEPRLRQKKQQSFATEEELRIRRLTTVIKQGNFQTLCNDLQHNKPTMHF